MDALPTKVDLCMYIYMYILRAQLEIRNEEV